MAGNPLDFKKTIIHSAGSGVNASDSSAGRASLPTLNNEKAVETKVEEMQARKEATETAKMSKPASERPETHPEKDNNKKPQMTESCVFCAHNHDVYCDIHACSVALFNDDKHGCHYWQPKHAEGPHRCGECGGFAFTSAAETWGICKLGQIKKEIHKNTYACNQFFKEGDNVPKRTFWTKCGRQFEKNSTAIVTGYHIDLQDDGSIPAHLKGNDDLAECVKCPFKIKVTEGWSDPVFKRWECRAGSQPPNHKTEWKGNLKDKATIYIHSLDHELLEAIRLFCNDHPNLGCGYLADSMADCRRTLSISCSPNKKGIAAKRELIEKFFPDTVSLPDETSGRNDAIKQPCCGDCKIGHWYSAEDTHIRVVDDDGKITNRPSEPHTHYCYQFIDGQRKIASDEDFDPNTSPSWCPLKEEEHAQDQVVSDNAVTAKNNIDQNKCDISDCEHNTNSKCSLIGVKGSMMRHFIKNIKENECIHIIRLRLKYLREIRNCNNANDNCSAISCNIAANNDYCCYNCQQPCERRCAHSDDLVPYGLIKLKYGNYDLLTAENLNNPDPDAALNNHLQYIRKKSEDVVNNYVEIGFALISLRDSKLYKARGYSNLIECIEAELGMKKSTAYNLMKIAEKFGDPETKRLAPQYSQYNYVQCLEMSTMSDDELAQVSPDMTRREMKKLKDSNRLESSKQEKDITIDPYDESIIDVTEYKTEADEKDAALLCPANDEVTGEHDDSDINISILKVDVPERFKVNPDPQTAKEIDRKIDIAGSCINHACEVLGSIKDDYYNENEAISQKNRYINQISGILFGLRNLKLNTEDQNIKLYEIIVNDGSEDLTAKLATAYKKIRDLELALKQSRDEHKSKNDRHKSQIEYLEKKIRELTAKVGADASDT